MADKVDAAYRDRDNRVLSELNGSTLILLAIIVIIACSCFE